MNLMKHKSKNTFAKHSIIIAAAAFLTCGILFAEEQPLNTTEKIPDTKSFVLIKDGTFIMGSPKSEPERFNDEIQHKVTVSSFYIGKYEVTIFS